MAVVKRFNVNTQQVTLDANIIENMSANDVSYDASFKYDKNTVGDKLSDLEKSIIGVDGNFISGKYLNANYQEIDNEDYCISDYIEVSRYNRVIWTFGVGKTKGKIVIYNADKEQK